VNLTIISENVEIQYKLSSLMDAEVVTMKKLSAASNAFLRLISAKK